MLSNDAVVHVAAAVIQNQEGEVLLSLRPKDSHQGGLWEFPGRLRWCRSLGPKLSIHRHHEPALLLAGKPGRGHAL